MTDNMKIWDAVSKTNPADTKRVNQRGGFTAIGAHSQILAATKQFGPVGVGWGYDVMKVERLDEFILVYVDIWHGSRADRFGPVLGCASMFGARPDHDAPKKATTDAITKGLSQLGFNADVFLGKFDDNKYVAEVTREFAKGQNAGSQEHKKATKEEIDAACEAIESKMTLEFLGEYWKGLNENALHVAKNNDVISAKDERKAELTRAMTNQGAG